MLNRIAIDLIQDGREYKAVIIAYDSLTGEAEVVGTEVLGDNVDRALYEMNKYITNKIFNVQDLRFSLDKYETKKPKYHNKKKES